jgi:hypothetical protein
MAKDHQNQTYVYPTVGGTANVITLTNAPAKTALAAGQKGTFKAGSNNTTGVTLNEDGLGAKNLYKMNAGSLVALVANDLVAGGAYDYIYDGTQYQVKGLAEGPYSSGALKYLGSATASSSSTINLTSLLSSTYDDYIIILDNIVPSTTAQLFMRFSTDNSTFDSTLGDYLYAYTGYNSAAGTVTGSSANAQQIQMTNNLDNTRGMSGQVRLYNVNLTSNYRYCRFDATYYDGVNFVTLSGGGEWKDSTHTLEAVQFLTSTGILASGTFKVYGVAKS